MGRRSAKDGFHRPFADLAKAAAAPKAADAATGKGNAPPSKGSAAPTKGNALPATVNSPPARSASKKISSAGTDEDASLFLQAVTGAQPLARAPNESRIAPAVKPPRPRTSDDAEVMAALSDLVADGGGLELDVVGELVTGLSHGADRRLLKRLRGGEFAIHARIDLHGMTEREARDRVTRFLTSGRASGSRCILVVHGRGLHSEGGTAVLKQALLGWLARPPLVRIVLALCSASPEEGGAGAMLVLLRK